MFQYFLPTTLVALVALSACKKDDDQSDQAPVEQASEGVVSSVVSEPTGPGVATVVTPTPTPPANPGNTEPDPIPRVIIGSHPTDPTFVRDATFSFSAQNFSAGSFECSSDGSTFSSCSSPVVLRGLSPGGHIFQVRHSHNGGYLTAEFAWTVDQSISPHSVNNASALPSSAYFQDFHEAGSVLYMATNKGLLFSDNDGKTVRVIDSGSGLGQNFTYKTLLVDDHYFAATAGGLIISSNKGQTVTNKTISNGLYATYVGTIAYDKSIGRLYIGHNTGLSYSDDKGQSFVQKASITGLPSPSGYAQIFVSSSGRIFTRTITNRIYTGTSINGAFSEIVVPNSATAVRIYVTDSGRLYAATANGVFFSADNGATFQRKTTAEGLPSNNVYTVHASEDGSVVVAGTDAGLGISYDSGATFTAVSLQDVAGTNSVNRLNFDESGRLLISTNYAIYRTSYFANALSKSFSDYDPPMVTDASSFRLLNTGSTGTSTTWTAAIDNSTSKTALVYELFSAAAGTSLDTLQDIYTEGTLVGRFTGTTFAPAYLNAGESFELAVVAKDSAGNKTTYNPVSVTTASAAPTQTWTEETADAGIGKLVDHRVVSTGNKLFIVGGIVLDPMPITVQNKVAVSLDGVNWSDIPQSGDFAERFDHGIAFFDGKVWIAAGTGSDTQPRNDVGYTTTGATWIETTAAAAFSPRTGQAMLTFNNKLWIIGGNTVSGGSWEMRSDVWSSSDGVTWTQATANAGFPAVAEPQVVAMGAYLYYLGAGTTQEVWRSANGSTWEKLLATKPTGTLHDYAPVVHDNHMYLLGGSGANAGVWKSPDGVLWEEIDTASTMPDRDWHAGISFANKLWIFQGTSIGYKADIWSGIEIE